MIWNWLLGKHIDKGPIEGIGSLRDWRVSDIRDPIITRAKWAQRAYDMAMAIGSVEEQHKAKQQLDAAIEAMRAKGWWR